MQYTLASITKSGFKISVFEYSINTTDYWEPGIVFRIRITHCDSGEEITSEIGFMEDDPLLVRNKIGESLLKGRTVVKSLASDILRNNLKLVIEDYEEKERTTYISICDITIASYHQFGESYKKENQVKDFFLFRVSNSFIAGSR